MAAAAFEVPAALTTSESTMAAERAAAPVQAVEPTPASPWTQRTAHDIGGPRTRTGDVVLAEPADFESLLLSRPVLEGLRAAGFERPSPVQLKAIPLGRCGLDLIVQAKSGTGKTCVFSTIALDSLILENYSTQILILAPTREIAVQIHSVITAIGIKMEGLECHVFIGGTPLSQDKTRLKKCHIAVGSPGRIKQLIELDYLNPGSIRLFILDEADKLLEEGSFQEQINWIYSSLPASKQMLAVSATYPEVLANALTRYMRDPTFVRLNPSDPSLIGLKQYYQVVNSYPLAHKIFEEKTQHLQELFSKVPFNQALVFSNLHSRAQHLADILSSKGFPTECISGNMNQNQRLDAMAKLKQFHCRVLISTDLTSRGIDAEKVNLVVNLDVPLDWETYMHRIGRAGRFGTLGLTVTYCCRGEEENMMMKIAQKCNINLLPLPDPIPPGLMEECLNWDVEVKAAMHTYSSPTVATQSPKKQVQKLERAFQSQRTPGNQTPSPRNTSASALSARPKHSKPKLPVKSHSECGVLEKAAPPQESGCPAQLEEQVKNSVQTSVEDSSSNSQHQAKDSSPGSLPKIPCLSSFKVHQPSTLTFAELVDDYEHYIKEGLEKPVEIIRHYTGPEAQTGNPQNGFVRNRVSEDRAQMLVSSSQSGDSESDSDSCSSRTSSQSKGNKSYLEGSSDTQLKDTECTPVGGPLSLEQVQNGNDTPTQVEYQEAPETQVKARHKEGANQRSKQSRRNPARRSSYRVQSEPQEEGRMLSGFFFFFHRERESFKAGPASPGTQTTPIPEAQAQAPPPPRPSGRSHVARLRLAMAAPVDGSSGGWAARALRRALALTSLTTLALLASLTGLLLSGPAGALPTLGPGWQRQNPDPPVSRTRSLLLDAASGQLRLEDGFHPDAVAWANLTNAIRETGWAYLDLSTNGRYNDSLQAYAAGVVEASVSEELIYMHWMNTVVNYCGPFEYEVGYCEKLKNFLEANLEWMQREMELNPDSPYWHQVRLTLLQLKGLEDSYEGRLTFPTGRFTIKPLGFLLLQISGDLEDLEPALNKTNTKPSLGSGSCSALIKLLPGGHDLLVAHNTWNSYQNMLRIIKKYRLQFREGPQEEYPLVAGNNLVFSSYPGTIFSGDDFYILGSGLVTLETTIGNKNPALWKYVQPQGCVLEWIRNVVANRLALDGATWADVFKRFNSGTYNNQWMIVDYKAFLPNGPSPGSRVLTILEQIPGMVVVADKTAELYKTTYWASYNIPYFETVFNASGLQALVAQYGDWFSYTKNPRAKIFQRDQSLVEDMDAMVRLMRYNDFLHDPLSLCEACNPKPNAENAISARSDLNPANGSYPFQALHQRAHGGIDVKVTSFTLAKYMSMLAASGPTWDQCPPFQWSKSPFHSMLHMGQPDLWMFSPIRVPWD